MAGRLFKAEAFTNISEFASNFTDKVFFVVANEADDKNYVVSDEALFSLFSGKNSFFIDEIDNSTFVVLTGTEVQALMKQIDTELDTINTALPNKLEASDLAGLLVAANNLSDIDTPVAARSNLGLSIGSDVQAFANILETLSNITPGIGVLFNDGADNLSYITIGTLAQLNTINNSNWSGTDLSVLNGGTGSSTASGARSNLGLGSLAILNTINNGNWSGTDLSVANGGTGSSTAANARTALAVLGTAGGTMTGAILGDQSARLYEPLDSPIVFTGATQSLDSISPNTWHRVDTSGGAITIDIGAAADATHSVGYEFTFAKIDSTSNFAFSASGGQTIISKGGSLIFNSLGDVIHVKKTGASEWFLWSN